MYLAVSDSLKVKASAPLIADGMVSKQMDTWYAHNNLPEKSLILKNTYVHQGWLWNLLLSRFNPRAQPLHTFGVHDVQGWVWGFLTAITGARGQSDEGPETLRELRNLST